ncbi:MAG: hypothetical protein SVW02_00730 [Candidatus Nanohaloarchaea archaeon]|nr:hypothetical protein [Candidatus Nanohaloarchaea archaeon]
MHFDGVSRDEYPTDEYYIDGDLAYLIASIQEWGDFNTYREASEKTAELLTRSPVGLVIVADVDGHEIPEPMKELVDAVRSSP